MSKSIAYKHYVRALTHWPSDPLRPELSFAAIIHSRAQKRLANPSSPPSPETEAAELRQANALYSLLEDRYTKRYAVSDKFFEPQSNPGYYATLLHEIEEAPGRSWFSRTLKRWKGMIRFK